MTRIRRAISQDLEDIRNVHMHAFPEEENHIIAELAVRILGEETIPEMITLVAEVGGKIVGHIAFTPVSAKVSKNWLGYILAPLGVEPEHQRSGIGKKLIDSGIARITEKAVNVLFVYGDPEYYGKFGFSARAAKKYLPPYKLQYPLGWQAIVLNEGGANENAVELSCVASLCDPILW